MSTGTCNAVTAGDLLEDIFGYTDSESSNLIRMAPVVVGENLTAEEAATVAQMLTEYGIEVSVTDNDDRFVDLSGKANRSVFDSSGKLLSSAAAIIGALTVGNRIRAYRRFRRPSLVERLFHINYRPVPVVYHRHFRPFIDTEPVLPRRVIKKQDPMSRFGAGGLGIDMNKRRNNRGPGAERRGRSEGPSGDKRNSGKGPGGMKGPGGRH